jgi:hypothetical protein
MRNSASIKEMAQKMLFSFTNILLHILGYSFCTEGHILVQYCKIALAIKSVKHYQHESCSALVSKMLVKWTPKFKQAQQLIEH